MVETDAEKRAAIKRRLGDLLKEARYIARDQALTRIEKSIVEALTLLGDLD